MAEKPTEQQQQKPQPTPAPQQEPSVLAALEPNERGIRKMLFDQSLQAQVFASLPPAIPADKFAALCLDQFQAMLAQLSPDLQQRVYRNPVLVLRAAQRTAALGLLPGKGSQEVAWIFRKGWQKSKDNTVVPDSIDVMPQWQAFIRLMRQAEGVLDVEAVLVHSSDIFRYRDGEITHEFDPFDEDRVFLNPEMAGERPHGLRGGYLRITYQDGRVRFHMVPFAKIDANRRCSKNPAGDDPWGRWYPEQVQKTIVRDAAARRVVDWNVDTLERMSAIEKAAREADGEDPARGGYFDTTADHAPAPRALGQEALRPVNVGVNALKQRLGVPVASGGGGQDERKSAKAAVVQVEAESAPQKAAGPCCPQCGSDVGWMAKEDLADVVKLGCCPNCPA